MAVLWILPALIVLAGIYLLLIAPGRRSMTPFDGVPIAHRGFHTETPEAPENSLAAFRRARQADFGAELDIQFTADRQLVVFHDETLKRVCGADIPVRSLSFAQLQAYPIQGGESRIPLFSEVLAELDGAPVVVELKSYGSNGDTSLCEAAWPLLAAYKGPICVESFNPLMLRWFRRHHPEMRRGILAMHYRDEVAPALRVPLSALLTNCLTRPDFVAYRIADGRALSLRLCRRMGAATLGWTAESPADATRAQALGFDNVIFEQYDPRTLNTAKPE